MSLVPGTKTYEYAVRETTLWEDILVDKNILAPDEKLVRQKEAIEAAKLRTERSEPTALERIAAAKNDKDKLDELEDEFANDDDDERLLEKFRQARMQEMKKEAAQARFGSVETLARDEFIAQVTETSKTGGMGGGPLYVIVELFREGLDRSALTSRAFEEVARKNPKVKFVKMVADQCIQGWPDSRVPSIIIYYNGELKHQFIGLVDCGNGSVRGLWKALADWKVLPNPPTEDEDDDDNGALESKTSAHHLHRPKEDDW